MKCDIQHNDTQHVSMMVLVQLSCVSFMLNVIMLNVANKPFMPSVIILNGVMLSVVMLNVVAPIMLSAVLLNVSFQSVI